MAAPWIDAALARVKLQGWLKAVTSFAPRTAALPGPLDLSRFAGSFDKRTRDALNGGQSTYDGTLTVTQLPRALVAGILPPDLQLAAPSNPTDKDHPVIVLLGRQYDLLWLSGGSLLPSGASPYRELMLIVPFTVRAPGTKWHNFVARMYLDNLNAVIIGDVFYAYAKLPAGFTVQGTKTSVQVPAGTVYQSDVHPQGPAVSLAAGAPLPAGFRDVMDVFSMPMVGYFGSTPPPEVPDGLRYSCSYFEWDYAGAFATPAESTHSFLQEFRPGMQGWITRGPMTNAPQGAFSISGLRWRLSYELPLLPPNMPPTCNFY